MAGPSHANAPGGSFGRQRKSKFSKKNSQTQRPLDPAMLLSRGLSARFVGANIPLITSSNNSTSNGSNNNNVGHPALAPLNKEEMEKDLRLMNAYFQANISYAQQHYMYMNRGSPAAAAAFAQNGMGGDEAAFQELMAQQQQHQAAMVAMPVRIDPEEEKRLSNLRRKIALCETQREFLESQYVSLRAHYVATTKELAHASKHNEALVAFLQQVTARRAKVLALQRARLQMARDVAACLQTRLEAVGSTAGNNGSAATPAAVNTGDATTDGPETTAADADADLLQVWSDMEGMLAEAEEACRNVPSTLTLQDKKRKKSKKNSKENGGVAAKNVPASVDGPAKFGILPWGAIKLPNTPQGVPLYLSQLAVVPEKGAAYGTSGAFGAKPSSLCWLESSLPETYNAVAEEDTLVKLREEVQFLEEELTKERDENRELQSVIVTRRKRSDELVAMMTLLRGETEAILQRHNILLDSDIAKEAAQRLHEEHVKNRGKNAANSSSADVVPPDDVADDNAEETDVLASKKTVGGKDDNENDGDDEGDNDDDDDEEGEIVESSKRGLEEDEESSSPRRKKSKV